MSGRPSSRPGGRGGRDRGGGRGGRGRPSIFDDASRDREARGRGDRGRGDRGRGDRGFARGGRGRGAPTEVTVFSRGDSQIPVPDRKVQQVEDQYDTSVAKGGLSLDQLSIDRKFPLRPAYGTQGKPVTLWANYFELTSSQRLLLHRYKVEVQPEGGRTPTGRKLKRILELLLEDHFAASRNDIATDYKATLICRTALQTDQQHFKVQYRLEGEDEPPEDAKTFDVKVIPTGSLDPTTLLQYLASPNAGATYSTKEDVIQALNIIIGHHPKMSPAFLSVGANKHFAADSTHSERMSLGQGLEVLRGFFVSVRAATSRLLVNVQVKHIACYDNVTLDKLIADYSRGGTVPTTVLQRFLRRLRVRAIHILRKNKAGQEIPRIKTIAGLATPQDGRGLPNPPRVPTIGAGPKDVKFYLSGPADAPGRKTSDSKVTATKKGKKAGASPGAKPSGDLPGEGYISVYDFFVRVHKRADLNPRLPVVNVGNMQNPSYLPAEVCVVEPGQPANGKLSPGQTQAMIRFAVRRPSENASSIVTSGPLVLGVSPHKSAVLKSMNLSISQNLITVPGRLLQGPSVQYNASTTHPKFGSWNMQNVAFVGGTTLPAWTYLFIRDRPSQAPPNDSITEFCRLAKRQGINVPNPTPPFMVEVGRDIAHNEAVIDAAFQKAVNHPSKPRLLLVILPFEDSPIYNRVKFRGDIKDGIHTICVVASKFTRNNPQYFANVCLKFNLKLGGVNHQLDSSKLGVIAKGKTMVVGIDVTHPSPGSSAGAPSVAGMAASIDSRLGQWPATIRLQKKARTEMVDHLDTMLQSRLRLWQTRNKSLPDNILIYRDGVSEGQYGTVLEQELPLLQSACRKIYPADSTKKGLPKMSIIVVGKRHHTRFYPTDPREADRSSNPANGTVVDRGVTETRNWDFFLQAHAALQGTARPAHYFVVMDEIFSQHKGPRSTSNVADELENLTHNLCYLYGRATKAVSVCPPAYYADLVCERARRYLSRLFDPTPSQTPSASVISGDTGRTATDTQSEQDIMIHPTLANSMFYI